MLTPDITTPADPLQSDLVRLYNKTERTFSHEHKVDGKATKWRLPGGTFARVPREVADKWLSMFPNDVVTDNEAYANLGAKDAELAEAKKRIAELEKAAAPATPKKKTRTTDVV